MKRKTDGAITVFLSCILLIIVVFSCTIIDYTRIRVVRLQSLRALNNATNSILSNYDSQISDEYGIFMLEKDEYIDKIEDYVNASLIPNEELPKLNKIYQVFHEEDMKSFNLYDYDLDVTDIKPANNIIDKNPDYLRLQILEYMKYRAPLLAIEPFLEKLQLVSKSSKTTDLLEKKMEINNKVSDIDDKYRELEQLIDGIEVNKKGKIKYKEYFVKRLLAKNDANKSNCFKEINNDYVRTTLQNSMIIIDEEIDTIVDNIDNINNNSETLVDRFLEIDNINKEIDEILSIELLSISDELKLEELRDTRDEYREAFEEQLGEIENYKNDFDEAVSHITDIELFLEKNSRAIDIIHQIKEDGENVKGSIDKLENDINENRDEVIESTTVAIEDELQELKGRLVISDDEEEKYNLVNNIYAIKDELENNVEILESLLPHTVKLNNLSKNLVNNLIDKEFDSDEDNIFQSFIGELESSSSLMDNQNRYQTIDYDYSDEMKKVLDNIKDKINDKYLTSNMVFNYGDMKTLSKDEKDKIDPRNEVKEATKDIELNSEASDLTDNVDQSILPSIVSKDKDYIELITDESTDFYSKKNNYVNKSLSVFGGISDKLKNMAYDLRDEVYINEYILGNFSSATDNLPNADSLTLSNYSKDEHYMENEVEYILRGSLNEKTNLKHASNTILGIRFAMNYIHILTNSAKRTLVISIATAIAGWWTFGLGTYIVAALIMAAWSYAESCVDVRYLLKGEEIPFIKTSGDWFTSIEGISKGLIDKATEEVCDVSMQLINKATTSLKNNITSVTNKLDENVRGYAENKLSRVLDDASRSLKYSIDEIDDKVDSVINKSFNNIRKNMAKKPQASDYNNAILDGLINELIDKIYSNYYNRIVDASYSEIISIKKEILDEFDNKTKKVKEKIINKVNKEISNINDTIESELIKVVDNTSLKYKELTKKQIKKVADNVREKTSDKINISIDNAMGTKDKGSKIKALIPTFSYNDYLRLMLLIGVDDNKKLYRVMDLIQLNLQKSKDNKKFNLSKYVSGYNVSAKVSVNFLFFDLPFMPDEAKKLNKRGYTFNINTLMAY